MKDKDEFHYLFEEIREDILKTYLRTNDEDALSKCMETIKNFTLEQKEIENDFISLKNSVDIIKNKLERIKKLKAEIDNCA